MHHLCCCRS